MTHRDPEHRGTPRTSNRTMSWLVAGAAVALTVIVLVSWEITGGGEEMDLANRTPVVEDQDNMVVDEDEVVEENTQSSVEPALPATDGTADGPIEETGQAIKRGPEGMSVPARGDEENAVADEAARENRIIEQNAEQDDQENSPVTDAQRTAAEIQAENEDTSVQ